jgi:hypothetical protein
MARLATGLFDCSIYAAQRTCPARDWSAHAMGSDAVGSAMRWARGAIGGWSDCLCHSSSRAPGGEKRRARPFQRAASARRASRRAMARLATGCSITSVLTSRRLRMNWRRYEPPGNEERMARRPGMLVRDRTGISRVALRLGGWRVARWRPSGGPRAPLPPAGALEQESEIPTTCGHECDELPTAQLRRAAGSWLLCRWTNRSRL